MYGRSRLQQFIHDMSFIFSPRRYDIPPLLPPVDYPEPRQPIGSTPERPPPQRIQVAGRPPVTGRVVKRIVVTDEYGSVIGRATIEDLRK